MYRILLACVAAALFAGPIRWSFEEFLIARDGTVVARFQSAVDPSTREFEDRLREELTKK